MKIKTLDTLFTLCVNHIQGKDSIVYVEVSDKDVKDAAKDIIDTEARAVNKVKEKIELLSIHERLNILNHLKRQSK